MSLCVWAVCCVCCVACFILAHNSNIPVKVSQNSHTKPHVFGWEWQTLNFLQHHWDACRACKADNLKAV